MPNISRRQFLEGATAGAAAVGAIAAAPTILGGTSHQLRTRALLPAAAVSAESVPATVGVVAHVLDAGSGDIVLYTGTREISITNTDIARALLAAAK